MQGILWLCSLALCGWDRTVRSAHNNITCKNILDIMVQIPVAISFSYTPAWSDVNSY